jgi:hypothetical protein
MKGVVILLIVAMVVLHQDFWFWHRHEPMVFGFIPIGLAWHVGISLAAGLIAFLAVKFCWPKELDEIDKLPDARTGTHSH